jgi:CHASE2 domain-containing sensor protein
VSRSAPSLGRLIRRWLHLAYLLPVVYFLRPVFWDPLDFRFYDLFHSKCRIAPWTEVVVVGVDEPTRREVLPRPIFPLSRHTEVHAALTSQLDKAGARAIVFDFPFSEDVLDGRPDDLVEAFRTSGVIYLVMSLLEKPNVDSSGEESALFRGIVPHPDLTAASNGSFVDGLSTDPDGVLRRLRPDPRLGPLGLELLPERLARYKVRKPVPIELPSSDLPIPVVSYRDVLQGDEGAKALIEGRIAFVGSLLDESRERVAVPRLQLLSDGRRALELPRVVALAAITETLLRGAPIRDVGPGLVLLWNLLWCLLLIALVHGRSPLLAALAIPVVLILSLVATGILHCIVGLVMPGGLLLGCVVICGLHAMIASHIEALKARLAEAPEAGRSSQAGPSTSARRSGSERRSSPERRGQELHDKG